MTRREAIEKEIRYIEGEIKENAKRAHFGSTWFSEYYDHQVDKIRALKEELEKEKEEK